MLKYVIFFGLYCVILAYAASLAMNDLFYLKERHDDVIDSLNSFRLQNNTRSLRHDSRLSCAAQKQAYDMFQMSACITTGKGGETMRKRAEDCEYPFSEGEMLVICQPKHERDLLFQLATNYREKLLKYRYIGRGSFLNYHVVFLAN